MCCCWLFTTAENSAKLTPTTSHKQAGGRGWCVQLVHAHLLLALELLEVGVRRRLLLRMHDVRQALRGRSTGLRAPAPRRLLLLLLLLLLLGLLLLLLPLLPLLLLQ